VKKLHSDHPSVRDLFDQQRRLVASRDPAERLKTLWVGVLLGEHLAKCSDRQIGDLLSVVQDGLGLFSAEFAVCEHAKRRLQRSSSEPRKENWRAIRDTGSELMHAEVALFRSGIPHMLLPFQRDRFLSNVFYVASAAEARACLLRQGFRSILQSDAMLLDSETNRTIRLIEAGQEKS
jgi:hypothetical protein